MIDYQPSSGFGWIDFSDIDKQKVLKVLELLKPEGTVDELGVGVVRNSLSDAMFSGITTIMTRAKYYLIVPQILHSYLTLKNKPVNAKEYLRSQENDIMNELTKKYKDDGTLEKQKIIGYTIGLVNLNLSKKHYKEVERKPSTTYWNGIRTFGIYKGQLSLSNFLYFLDNNKTGNVSTGYIVGDGENGDDKDAVHNGFFPFSLPNYDKNWRDNLSISLSSEEGEFLRHQILDTQKEKLIGLVLTDKDWIRDFLKPKNFRDLCDMPFVSKLPVETQTIMFIARDFWQIMYGAHIRFNIILHSRHGSEKYLKTCSDLWNNWVKEMKKFDWNKFDRDVVWHITKSHSKIKPFTERFINKWMDMIRDGKYNDSVLDELVEKQERNNKQGRSKLRNDNNELYKEWVGIDRMDYRLDNTQTIIRDIASSIGAIND